MQRSKLTRLDAHWSHGTLFAATVLGTPLSRLRKLWLMGAGWPRSSGRSSYNAVGKGEVEEFDDDAWPDIASERRHSRPYAPRRSEEDD